MKKNIMLLILFCVFLNSCSLMKSPYPLNDFGSIDQGVFTYQGGYNKNKMIGPDFKIVDLPKCNNVRLNLPAYDVEEGKLLIGGSDGLKNKALNYPIVLNRDLEIVHSCKELTYIDWAEFYDTEMNIVIAYSPYKIFLVDMEKCEIIKNLVNFELDAPFAGASWNSERNLLAYGMKKHYPLENRSGYETHILNPANHSSPVVIEGAYLAWSKSGELIAVLQEQAMVILDTEWNVVQKVDLSKYQSYLSDMSHLDWDGSENNILISIISAQNENDKFAVYLYDIAKDKIKLVLTDATDARWIPAEFCGVEQ